MDCDSSRYPIVIVIVTCSRSDKSPVGVPLSAVAALKALLQHISCSTEVRHSAIRIITSMMLLQDSLNDHRKAMSTDNVTMAAGRDAFSGTTFSHLHL